MTRICSFVLGATATLMFSACGSDDISGTKGSGGNGASTGGSGTGTGGSATGTGGSATGTGGSATSMGGKTAGTGGSATGTGGSATGTGGSATATGGTGGASNCQMACQKLKAASCGDLTMTNCSTACGSAGICASEADAYYACVASTGAVSCDTMMNSLVAGCDPTGEALDICAVCLPQAMDTACDTCTSTSCCTQLRAYVSSADVEPFAACISAAACMTRACRDGCVSMYPIAGKAYNTAISCQSNSCVNDCLCAPDADDNDCVACVKTSCCAAFGAYINAADFPAFDACGAACVATDAACFDACATASPLAAAAFDSLDSSCLSTTCSTACTAP